MRLKEYFQKYKLGGLYIKILLVFSAILLLSVIMSVGIIYKSLSGQVKSKIVRLADNALEHTRAVVENEMEELYIYSGTVGANIPMSKAYRDMSILEKQELSRDFFGRFYSYGYFDSVYLYYIEDRVVVSNKFGTNKLEDFIDRGWYDVYVKERAESPHLPMLLYDRRNVATQEDVMTYIYEYPKYSEKPKVALVVNISRNRAFEVGHVMPENTQLMILDNSDQLIYGDRQLYESTDRAENLGKNHIVKEAGSGWKYVAVFDEQQLDLDNRQAVWLLFWVLVFGIPLSIILCVVVSFKLYSPLINMLERLMSISGSENMVFDERKQLNYAVDNMMVMTDKITNISKKNDEIMRCTLLTTLCSGDFEQQEIMADMRAAGFSAEPSRYAVFLAEVLEDPSSKPNREQYHVIKMGLTNAMENCLGGDQAVLTEFVSRNRVLMLAELGLSQKEPAVLAEAVKTIMKEEYGISVLTGYGNIADDTEQISISYLESMDSLQREIQQTQPAADTAGAELKEDSAIKIIKEYIDNHYQEEITLVTMAEKVYLTPNYLSSKFKKVLGIGMIEYVNDVRIEKAKEILLKTTKNNETIATELGFTNVRSFLRSFKNNVGKTPTEYRAASIKNEQNI